MRYLKKFNESVSSDDIIKEFTDTTNNYLAYLLDEGTAVRISDKTSHYPYANTINLHVVIETWDKGLETCRWDDIKDYIIPYFEFLGSEYSFSELEEGEVMIKYYREWNKFNDANTGNYMTNYVKLKDIVNDNLLFIDGAYHKNDDYDIKDYISKISFIIKIDKE